MRAQSRQSRKRIKYKCNTFKEGKLPVWGLNQVLLVMSRAPVTTTLNFLTLLEAEIHQQVLADYYNYNHSHRQEVFTTTCHSCLQGKPQICCDSLQLS